MKKLFLSLMSLCALGAHADEGMWTLYNLPTAIYQQMQQEGFQLPMEQLYQSDNAIKNNVINFSGYCSGVVVSPNGLIFTKNIVTIPQRISPMITAITRISHARYHGSSLRLVI